MLMLCTVNIHINNDINFINIIAMYRYIHFKTKICDWLAHNFIINYIIKDINKKIYFLILFYFYNIILNNYIFILRRRDENINMNKSYNNSI